MLKREKAKIFIDIDGVVGDLHNHIEKEFNTKLNNFSKTKSFAKLLGFTPQAFANKLDSITFWKNVPLKAGAHNFVNHLMKITFNCYFCTTIISPRGNAGRALWIKKHFSEFYENKRFIFSHHKWLLADAHSILIDDYEKNIRKFQEAGGYGILYPAPWNRYGGFDVNFVKFELDNILINEEEAS